MQDGKFSINLGGWHIGITILLCILKLTEIIDISWWWCFCLIWLPFALFIGVCLLLVIGAFLWAVGATTIDLIKKKK